MIKVQQQVTPNVTIVMRVDPIVASMRALLRTHLLPVLLRPPLFNLHNISNLENLLEGVVTKSLVSIFLAKYIGGKYFLFFAF